MSTVHHASQSVRLFYGLMVGGELGERLMAATVAALGGERRARRGFRLPRAEGLHLTLLFLGDVERALVEPLWEGVLSGAGGPEGRGGAASPELVVDRSGAFPKPGRERVLWLGVREERHPGRLERLFQRVLAAARGAGHDTSAEEKRPFRPHVTVARPKRPGAAGARVPPDFYALAPELAWSPRRLALVESVPAGEGPRHYRPIRELPLEP